MVYCTKCGTKNEENALVCVKCGTRLYKTPPSFEKRIEEAVEGAVGEAAPEECFGIPHGGAVVGLVIGLIIIIVGLGLLFKVEVWPAIVIIFGIVVLVGAIYGLRRRY